MAASLKHIGKIKNTGMKVLVAFRTIPGDSHMSLVIPTATLPDAYHDSIMTLVETDQAQESFEFGEILHIRRFPDGRPMLQALSQDGRMQRVTTDNVIMTPTINAEVALDELNNLIAEQKNCTIDDLCNFVAGAPNAKAKEEVQEVAKVKDMSEPTTSAPLKAKDNEVLSDGDLAKSYRSQADALYKEAARLRKQADELDPPKKKS